jgi:hypothetical protein
VTTSSTSSTPASQTCYVAQLASGGGWSTELYAFSRDRAASASLRLASFQGVGTTIAGLAPAWTGSGQAWNLSYDTLPTSSDGVGVGAGEVMATSLPAAPAAGAGRIWPQPPHDADRRTGPSPQCRTRSAPLRIARAARGS